MMIKFCNIFTKITAWPAQKIVFRTKIYYEDENVQKRRIKGSAVIISNHTSVFDYAAYLFVFFGRTLRFQMAEVLFKKKFLGKFLKLLGGIYIDRNTRDLGFIGETEKILDKGGVVGIFPEGRIPLPDEEKPLKFKEGAAYVALQTGAKIIPVFTNGKYFSKEGAEIIIGKPIFTRDIIDESLSDRENIKLVSEILRQKIIALEKILYEKQSKKIK